jgi:hypothetical protein
MYRTASDRARCLGAAVLVLLIAGAQNTSAQGKAEARATPQPQKILRIVSSEIAISRDNAELKLELSNGHKLTLSVVAGDARGELQSSVSGAPGDLSQILSLGAPRGDELDRSWRELLNEAMDTPTDELGPLLTRWQAPSGGAELDHALENALQGLPVVAGNTPNPDEPAVSSPEFSDSLNKLESEIERLNEELQSKHEEAFERAVRHRGPEWFSPLRHVGRGVAGVLSMLVTFAVLFGLGFATVFFGGRPYLEAVADATRHATTRSFLVGLAASFLVVPAFVLGIVVLAVSIIGIPVLLVWIPAFPLAVVLGTLLGYLAVAHGVGEALAEKRFYGGDWFSRANSYYYLLTGLGLLLVLFIAANVIEMAGPWLGFIQGILVFLGVVLTWAAATTGFGAVLITRAGSRPLPGRRGAESEIYADAPTE